MKDFFIEVVSCSLVYILEFWETFFIFVSVKNEMNMKNFFVGLTATLVGMQLGACASEKEPVQAIEREYVIVVHGGAGAI